MKKESIEKYAALLTETKQNSGKEVVHFTTSALQDKPEEYERLSDYIHRAADTVGHNNAYSWTLEALEWLQEQAEYTPDATIEEIRESAHEFIDGAVPIYTHDLLAWLAEDINNTSLVDQGTEEYGTSQDGIVKNIMIGYYYGLDYVTQGLIGLLEEEYE